MSHAIIRGKSGRRYEVDFEDSPVRVEIYASEETIEMEPYPMNANPLAPIGRPG